MPSGAHLFELPGKIGLPQDQYFTVQSIYRGWALFGIVLFAALAASTATAAEMRRRRRSWRPAALAAFLIAATLGVFFAWTFPANQATANWTVVPADWQDLRLQWEYAHAANAILTFAAFCAIVVSVLRDRTPP